MTFRPVIPFLEHLIKWVLGGQGKQQQPFHNGNHNREELEGVETTSIICNHSNTLWYRHISVSCGAILGTSWKPRAMVTPWNL